MTRQKLPNMSKPCKNCPFRKDSLKGWLGKARMTEILAADTFVCHANTNQQCAGHMLLLKEDNAFFRLAKRLDYGLDLRGEDLVFDNTQDCIDHHTH